MTMAKVACRMRGSRYVYMCVVLYCSVGVCVSALWTEFHLAFDFQWLRPKHKVRDEFGGGDGSCTTKPEIHRDLEHAIAASNCGRVI